MNKTTLLALAAISGVLTLLAIALLDQPLAELVRSSSIESAWIFPFGTSVLDLVTGKEVSKFLLGFVLLGAGAALLAAERTQAHGYSLLFVGTVQLSSTLVSGVSKNLFGRLRPFELLETGGWDHAWFVGGSSFPSGHTGFYFGLFLPLAYLYPRWRWPLLAVPFFIGVARIVDNVHFLSDVTASIALAALLTSGLATAMKRRLSAEGV
jgi:membrane-associated phospholipid phosphatase